MARYAAAVRGRDRRGLGGVCLYGCSLQQPARVPGYDLLCGFCRVGIRYDLGVP